MWREWDERICDFQFAICDWRACVGRLLQIANRQSQVANELRSINVPGSGDRQRGGDAEGQVSQWTDFVRRGAVECEIRRADQAAGLTGEYRARDRGAGLGGSRGGAAGGRGAGGP